MWDFVGRIFPLALVLPLFSSAVTVVHAAKFDRGTVVGHVNSHHIDEASGIAASRRHPGVLYTHNDSGDRPRIFAIDARTAKLLAIIDIRGATAQDWEDIAVGPGPGGQSYIYIGDIGGNIPSPSFRVYRVREPAEIKYQSLQVDSRIKFSWPERDSESLMVDPQGEVYLISKVRQHQAPKLYQLPKSAWGSSNRVRLTGSPIAFRASSPGPVAADISLRGDEILVKSYGSMRYWKRRGGERYRDTLSRQPASVSYRAERQGEAVGWDASGRNYYTLSEGRYQPLYLYRRIG